MPFTARDTVAIETFARLATSRMLTDGCRRFEAFFLDFFLTGFMDKEIVRFSECFSSCFSACSVRIVNVKAARIRVFERDSQLEGAGKPGWNTASWKAFPKVSPSTHTSLTSGVTRFTCSIFAMAAVLLGMDLTARRDLQPVPHKRQDGNETFFSSALAAGQVHNQRAAFQSGHSPRKPRKLIALRAPHTHRLCQSGRLAINHSARCLRRAVARSQACAACGQHQRRTLAAEIFKLARNCVFIVRQKPGPSLGL